MDSFIIQVAIIVLACVLGFAAGSVYVIIVLNSAQVIQNSDRYQWFKSYYSKVIGTPFTDKDIDKLIESEKARESKQ